MELMEPKVEQPEDDIEAKLEQMENGVPLGSGGEGNENSSNGFSEPKMDQGLEQDLALPKEEHMTQEQR